MNFLRSLRPISIGLAAVAVSIATAAPTRTSRPEKDPIDSAVKGFAKSHPGSASKSWFDSAQTHVRKSLGESPAATRLLDSLLAHAVTEGQKSQKSKFTTKKAKKQKGPAGERTFPLPREVMYTFGTRTLLPLDAATRELEASVKKGKPIDGSQLSDEIRFEQMLRGCLPDSELILAQIETSLDIHTTHDLYSQFLDSWRNGGPDGDESFYEALDRTAGTNEETFFYDAMLADFVGRFAQEEGKRWSLGVRHDQNQQAFLSYRQYRGLIEAVAFSLVLPTDAPLPARLSRYDYSSVTGGVYSLRHQLDILLAANDGNADAVLDWTRDLLRANPPPTALWDDYEPTLRFNEAFLAAVPDFTEKAKLSTDELLEVAKKIKGDLSTAIQTAANDASS